MMICDATPTPNKHPHSLRQLLLLQRNYIEKTTIVWSLSSFFCFMLLPRSSSILFGLAICNPAFQCATAFTTTTATTAFKVVSTRLYMASSSSSSSPKKTFVDAVSAAASESVGRTMELVTTSGGGFSGGGGASTSALLEEATNTKYFCKSATGALALAMLSAEYEGVKAMSDTYTIQVPTPIAFGKFETTGQAFALFEYLELCGGGSHYELGVMLAKVSE
jgi:hypothetical protein